MALDLRPPNDDDELIPVVLFPNAGKGAFHGITGNGLDSGSGYRLPEGYDRSQNMLCVDGNILTPWFSDEAPSSLGGFYQPIAFALPWTDTSTIPVPTLHIGSVQVARTVKNNASSNDTIVTTSFFTDGCFHDDGAGVAYLYAATVTNLITGAAGQLNRRTQAGVWTEASGVPAKRIASLGGALWRAVNDYQASKCPAGSNPFTAANWSSTPFQVGTNDARITSMGGIGAAPVIGKEDGLWFFVEADSRFENRVPVNRHPRNFTWMTPDGEGGFWTAPYDGSVLHVGQFGDITSYHPHRNKTPGRDTPRPIFTGGVQIADSLWLTTAAGEGAIQGHANNNLNALKTTDNFGTFTSYATEGDDRSFATNIDISSLDTLANGDALLIGFSDQFFAIEFIMSAVNANVATLTTAYSTGAGTWTTVTRTDETNGFSISGKIVMEFESVDLSTWVPASYNSLSRYWIRITTNAALDASTTIAEIGVVSRRTGPAWATSASPSSAHVEAAGCFSKLIRLRFANNVPLWDDVATMNLGQANKVVLTQLPSRNSLLASLFVLGKGSGAQFGYPSVQNPSIIPRPLLARDTVGDTPKGIANPPAFYPSSVDLGGWYELHHIQVEGRNIVAETDEVRVAATFDDTNPWQVQASGTQNFVTYDFGGRPFGQVLRAGVMLLDGSPADPAGPYITSMVAWVKPKRGERSVDNAWQTPGVG